MCAKKEKTNCSFGPWISSKECYNPKHKNLRVLGVISIWGKEGIANLTDMVNGY